jgi:hypothetical protein
MVWLIIALPVAAIVGGVLTIWIAVDQADTLVNEDHYKVGLAVHQGDPLERQAADLGIRAEIEAEGDELRIRLHGRYDEPPRGLTLTLSDPAGPGLRVDLPATGPELDRAVRPAIPAGSRHLAIEPDDRSWRITGQWEVPFTGTLQLAGGMKSPPPQP